jgi:hypothetical protein
LVPKQDLADSYVVMEKMNVRSLVDLVLIAERLLLKETAQFGES